MRLRSLFCLALLAGLIPTIGHSQTILNGSRTEDGTTWNLPDALVVGSGSGQSGTLNLINGGQAVANGVNITLGAGASNASGTVNVTGAGSTLDLTGGTTLLVGDQGQGTISVSGAGTLLTQTVNIGTQAGSTGTITLTGAGTTWNTRRWAMRIGMAGSGTVNLLDGAVFSNTSTVTIGDQSGSTGTMNLQGGATLSMGISTTSPTLHLGLSEGSQGTMTVGSGAQVVGPALVYVGNAGSGTLTVEGGGTMQARSNVYIARELTASGEVLVQGAGSVLYTTNDFRINASATFAPTNGSALVRVRDGGLIHSEADTVIRRFANVRVEAGGELRVEGALDAGTADTGGNLFLEGGMINVGGSFDASAPGFSWTAGTIHARGAVNNLSAVPAGRTLTLENGSVTSVTGTLSLQTGATVTGHGYILTNVHVGTGATLRGEGGSLIVLGTISGPGTIENVSHELRPDGTLTFTTNLDFTQVLQSSSEPVFIMDLADPASSDRIHFEGAEFRFGTHGLGLDSFDFNLHPGFGDGVYILVSSTEWFGGSLKMERRGTLGGRPVWLRIGNDGRTLELRVGAAAEEDPFVVGESYYGRNEYIEYIVGDLPLILTSGHDGGLQPAEIPARTWGTFARDTSTQPQTRAMADEIFNRTGRRPHMIISHLHRTRLDPNREIVEAAQFNIHAEQAWSEYHDTFITAARETAVKQAGFALLFDMHGHGHDIKRLELGYLLGATELNVDDNTLNLPGYAWQSSLRSMMLRNPGLPFTELIRGQASLGSRFNDRSVPAWPSAEFPTIGSAPFFNGGYTTSRHASRDDNHPTDAIQIESHGAVRTNATARAQFAVDFARVIQSYMVDYYGYSIDSNAFYSLSANASVTARGGAPIVVTIHRTGYRSFTSSMNLAFSGTAVRGVDYTVSAESVSYSSGQETATITITPAAAGPANGDRTIIVSMLPAYRQPADPNPVQITLGDGVSQTVRAHALSGTTFKDDGAAVFQLQRTHTQGTLTVGLSWEGTAIAGGHHFPPETATFAQGASTVEVVSPLRQDGIVEDDRTIRLTVNPGPDHILGLPAGAETVLTDSLRPRDLAVWLTDDLAGNSWKDRSGHERHATTLPAGSGPERVVLNGTPSVRFDGQSGTAAVPRLDLDPARGYTVAFHFRLQPNATTNEQNLFTFGERGGYGAVAAYLTTTANLRTWIGQPPVSTSSRLDVTGNWTNGQWWHYALTVSEDGTARIYINGNLARTGSGWNPPLQANQMFWLGWNPVRRAARGFMEGNMRDFRVYERPLGASEINSLAQEQMTYNAWVSQFGLDQADPPWDAQALLQGYVFGSRPDRLGSPLLYGLWSGTSLGLSFQRQFLATDLHYRVESSASLESGQWSTIAELPPGASSWSLPVPNIQLTDRHGMVEVIDQRPLGSDESRRFLRLRATQN